MASKKTKTRRKFTLPIALVAGTAGGLVIRPVGGQESPLQIFQKGNWNWGLHELIYNYTGYHGMSGQWMPQNARGLYAMVAGVAAHWIASKLGVNRMLGRAGIPVIRI